MNQDNSWDIIDETKIEKVNQIKDQLKFYSWEQVKSNPDMLAQAIDKNRTDLDPASMLMSERTFFLSQIFVNIQDIPAAVDNQVLEAFSTAKDQIDLKAKLDKIVPNLKVKNNAYTEKNIKDVAALLNGLNNLKKIALLKTTEQIYPYVLMLKKYNKDAITKLLSELKQAMDNINDNLDKNPKPEQIKIDKLVEVLTKLGRTPIQKEELKTQKLPVILDLAQMNLLALKIINLAYEKNQSELLDNIESTSTLLGEVLNK